MKVSDLQEILKRHDQDADVFVDGYDDGLIALEPLGVKIVTCFHRPDEDKSWSGPYQEDPDGDITGIVFRRY